MDHAIEVASESAGKAFTPPQRMDYGFPPVCRISSWLLTLNPLLFSGASSLVAFSWLQGRTGLLLFLPPGQNSLPLLRLQNLAPHQNKVLQYGCDRPGTMGGQVRDFAAACWVNNGHSRKLFSLLTSVVARFRIQRPKLAQCQSTRPRSVLARVYAVEV